MIQDNQRRERRPTASLAERQERKALQEIEGRAAMAEYEKDHQAVLDRMVKLRKARGQRTSGLIGALVADRDHRTAKRLRDVKLAAAASLGVSALLGSEEAQQIGKVLRDERVLAAKLGSVGFSDRLHHRVPHLLDVHRVARG